MTHDAYTPMSKIAQHKAEQILNGLAHQDAAQRLATCCALLAMLTSATKDDRESAKRRVRELIQLGHARQTAEQAAQNLANFANRNEP